MTPSRNETDRPQKGYVTIAIILSPIVLLAFVNGIMAFVRVFTHTLGAIFLTLEISAVGLAIGAVGFWLWQRDRRAGYARMQATLEQLLLENTSSLSLVEFAQKVQLPIPVARGFLDTAMREKQGNCQTNDRGELIYDFASDSVEEEPIQTVDVEAISTDRIDAVAAALFTSETTVTPEEVDEKNYQSEPQNVKIDSSTIESSDISRSSLVETQKSDRTTPVEHQTKKQIEKSSETAIEAPLIQAQLARRLSVSSSTLSYRKLKPNFSQWVSEKDPDGIAWRYSPQTRKFYPEDEEMS